MTGRPIMIMAGGTGGHVYPGLAVAERLAERRRDVVWLGTHAGIEATAVPKAGIPMQWISIAGLRRRGPAAWALGPFRVAIAVGQALSALRRSRPSAVLGMGGFVSGPGGIAARLARIPLLIHEQNAVVGTTNRILARFARCVFEGFPGSFAPAVGARWIGNPVRAGIAALAPPSERFAARGRARRCRLLVLGGSQGALALNRAVPNALAGLAADARPEVRHQAGRTLDECRAEYERAGVDARLDAFIDDMADAYGWADLVIARAGALTIAELAAAGVGAILVPYPHAVDDHQTVNARAFVANGAGALIPEAELDAARLTRELEQWLADPARLADAAERAREHARPDAADALAEACLAAAGSGA